jgi:hypothetical protein
MPRSSTHSFFTHQDEVFALGRVTTLYHYKKTSVAIIPFALQISAVSKEATGCSAKALPAWMLA